MAVMPTVEKKPEVVYKAPPPPPPPSLPRSFELTIRSAFSGEIIDSVTVRAQQRVSTIKRQLVVTTGVPLQYQQLAADGSQNVLVDSATVQDAGLSTGAIVNLVRKPLRQDESVWRACHNGDEVLLAYILKNSDVDVNQTDALGTYPLHVAARNGKRELVDLLLEARANANSEDARGRSPLHVVTSHVAANSLIDSSADLSCIHESIGVSAATYVLCLFACVGAAETVKMLLKKSAVVEYVFKPQAVSYQDARGDSRVNGLHYGSLVMVNRRTSLQSAAQMGKHDVVRILIEAKAKLNAVEQKGMTALHLAARSGKVEACEELLRHDPSSAVNAFPCWSILLADIRFGVKLNPVPSGPFAKSDRLHQPELGESDCVVRSLIDARDDAGETALHAACAFCGVGPGADDNVDQAAELKVVFETGRAGIKADWKSGLVGVVHEGEPAHQLGVRVGMRFLTVAGQAYTLDKFDAARDGTIRYEVTFAQEQAVVKIVRLLLDLNADPSALSHKLESPLSIVASTSTVAVCELLLAAGADAAWRDNSGSTLLHEVANRQLSQDSCWASMIESLISAGANATAKDSEGYTAWQRAEQYTWPESGQLIELLRHAAQFQVESSADVPTGFDRTNGDQADDSSGS